MALPSESDPLRSVWRRVLSLAPGDQLDLFVRLRDYLGDIAPPSPTDAQVAARREARESLGRACVDLGVTPSAGLTLNRYDEAAERLGLMPAPAVVRAFGSWRTALEVLAGRRMPQTARQIDQRRAARRGASCEEQLQMLRDFLETSPRAPTQAAYRDWAREENRKLPPGEPRRLLTAAIMARSGGLSWSELIALTRGQEPREPARESYPIFIALQQVARITGEAYTVVYRRGFPRPAAFSGHAQFWRRDEVFGYREGVKAPTGEAFSLQAELLFTADLARLLGVTQRVVAARVRRAGWERGLLPKPCAIIPNVQSLWWRSEVEEWLRPPPSDRAAGA